MTRSVVVAAVPAVFALGMAACGGDDDGGEPAVVAIESAPAVTGASS